MKLRTAPVAGLVSLTILAVGCVSAGPDDDPTTTVGNLDEHGAPFRAACDKGSGHQAGGTGGAAGTLGAAGADGTAGKLGSAGADGLAGKLGSTGSAGTQGAGGVGGSASSCATPPSGMVSWWHADGNYNDAVGSNNGTSGGDVTFGPGEINQGFQLDGTTNSRVSVPDSPSLDLTSAITIDAWISFTSPTGRIVDKITAFDTNGYLLDLVDGQARLFVAGYGLESPAVLTPGVLTHVAGSFDGTTMSLYVNGVLVASLATDGRPIPVNSNPLNFGVDSSGDSNYTGIIDEPRIFNRTLSADEIAAIFQSESAHCQ